MDERRIPTLTEVVSSPRNGLPAGPPALSESAIAELQTRLSAESFALVERLLHSAMKELEATLFDEVINRLRAELPDLVDKVLHEHLRKD